MKRLAVWLLAASATAYAAAARAEPPRPVLMTYYESWLDAGAGSPLPLLPRSVDLVAIAFARPDMRYSGRSTLAGTGLQFDRDGASVRADIAALRRRNPAVKAVLAVGGSAYRNWAALDAAAITRLVGDLGLDGIDLDFEPPSPACTHTGAGITCESDAAWQDITARLRAGLPPGALLTIPGWSVGAYGADAWRNARPASPWTGSMLALLHAPAARAIDLVSVMAYDAGPEFDPAQALAAYRGAWSGPLLLGASVADGAAWVTGIPSPGGVMLYGWLSRPPPGQPDAPALAAALCRRWHPDAACQ